MLFLGFAWLYRRYLVFVVLTRITVNFYRLVFTCAFNGKYLHRIDGEKIALFHTDRDTEKTSNAMEKIVDWRWKKYKDPFRPYSNSISRIDYAYFTMESTRGFPISLTLFKSISHRIIFNLFSLLSMVPVDNICDGLGNWAGRGKWSGKEEDSNSKEREESKVERGRERAPRR